MALGILFIANDFFSVSFGTKMDILVLPIFVFTLILYVSLTYKSTHGDVVFFRWNR
jgi:hypothetical protein